MNFKALDGDGSKNADQSMVSRTDLKDNELLLSSSKQSILQNLMEPRSMLLEVETNGENSGEFKMIKIKTNLSKKFWKTNESKDGSLIYVTCCFCEKLQIKGRKWV